VRATNQDQLLVLPPSAGPQAAPPSRPIEGQLLAVADGIGGHAGGERASNLAVRTVGSTLLPGLERVRVAGAPEGEVEATVLAEMCGAIERAHANVRAEASRRPELSDMGTTLTVAYILGGRLFIAHVGDSRCYLLRDGALFQLTRDHTVVNELVRAGFIKSAEEAGSAMRGLLTRAVGISSDRLDAETHLLRLRPGDTVLLCTDGVTGMLSEVEITAILESYTDPHEAARQLIAVANEAGGHDNITAVVARCEAAQGTAR
jgi:protein phosphatase